MKLFVTTLISVTLSLSTATSTFAQTALVPTPDAPAIASASGILFELDSGKVFWAKDDSMTRAPASLTKILTALVVIEHASLVARAHITPEARNAPGGRIYAEEGWSFTVRDLLYGLLLQSGNDAAVALGQKVSPDGTVAGFAEMMNVKAHQLGAVDSHFVNPHGYDEPGHLTTARDLAIITSAAMKNNLFREIVSTKTYDMTWGDGTPKTSINHNKLLWKYEGTVGIKTGFTGSAGHCLISAVTRNGKTLVLVLLGSPNALHYEESIALYDWTFTNIAGLETSPIGEIKAHAVAKPSKNESSNSVKHGLEVVQLGAQSNGAENKKTNPAAAPLLTPLLALAGAVGVGSLMRRRRRAPRGRRSISQFRGDVDLIRTQERENERVGR